MASSVRRFGKQSIRNWSKRSTSSILTLPTTSSSSSTTAFTTAASFKTASASSTASSYSPSLSHSALLDFISHSTSKVVVRVDDPKSGGGGDEGNHDDNPEDPEDHNKDDQQQFIIKIISYLLALIGGAAGVAMVLPEVNPRFILQLVLNLRTYGKLVSNIFNLISPDFDPLAKFTIGIWSAALFLYGVINLVLLFENLPWRKLFGKMLHITIATWIIYYISVVISWLR